MDYSLGVVAHDALTADDLRELRRLFDGEYVAEFGPWHPEQPYGYAGHDLHIIARSRGGIVGHVGWARRLIGVGGRELAIAGVGGVLVSSQARGDHLGGRLMRQAAASMAEFGGVSFGYLGCREEVVPFYLSCGWHRISAVERSISRSGMPIVENPGQPLLVLPIDRDLASWPDGAIELRGRAW